MNRISALGRKLIYLVVLVAMLVPLYLLGQPAGGGSAGGRLSVMRHDFNIAESDLGEISPASQTMKLASLGLRGVAATLLWNKAHDYRVTHEWDRLKAAVDNIALLQPHSEKVWEFHAHNLSYNVSTEFDDYRQRYAMVREGTEFLQRGVRQNRNATRLVWYTGWFYGSKLGMSDEKRQFRKLFADDQVLHEELLAEKIPVDSPEARGPLGKPDNWLVGRLWLNQGYDLVAKGVKIRRQTPLNFYETGPKWRIKHAEAIEKEGILDDRAQASWQMAAEDWDAFGNRSIPTTSPFTIKLGQLDELGRQREQKVEEFRELTGDAYVQALDELIEGLTDDLKVVLSKPASERTKEDETLAAMLEANLVPDFSAVAKASDPAVRLQAISLVDEIADLDARSNKTNGYRSQINFPYWKTLTQAEQEERTVTARRLIYEAERANAIADLDRAIELYEQAFEIWAEIFDDYPILTVDDTADDLADSIRHYMVAIDSQEFPDDFALAPFIEFLSQDRRPDPREYQRIRESMEEAAEKRRSELAEEERRREEAAKSEATEASDAKPAADESKDPESKDPEGDPAPAPQETPAASSESEPTEEPPAESETPEVETPEAETPEAETPEVETPEVETPEVETPGADAP